MMINELPLSSPCGSPEGAGQSSKSHGPDFALDETPLFQLMTRYGADVTVPAHRTLSATESENFRLGLIRTGYLLASVELPNDRRQVLCVYCPGDLVVTGVFGQRQRLKYKALCAVDMLGLSQAALQEATRQDPEVCAMLLSEATRHIEEMIMHSVAIGRLRSEERLATFFLELALRMGETTGEAATFELRMRREDIADYLCVNRDTLSRSMSRLRKDGVVIFSGPGQIIVLWRALSARTPLGESMLARYGRS